MDQPRPWYNKKRFLIPIGTVILLVLIGIFSPDSYTAPQPENQPIPTAELKSYKVTNVVDGDTIDIELSGKTERIRLIGINTAETVDPRKPVECFGKEASEKSKSVLNNATVTIETDSSQDSRDKYGRMLAYVFLSDGSNFNQMMIAEGYAYEYTYDKPYKYQKEFKEAQQKAQSEKKGLWSDTACSGQTNQPSQETPKVTPVPQYSGDMDCADFSSHEEAQAYFESKGGSPSNNVDRLDRDRDGLACEAN